MSSKSKESVLAMLPKEGFIKLAKPVHVDTKERVILIRKANEFWQKGEITQAERIFLTVSYMDGFMRLAEYYYDKHEFIKALAYFKLAKNDKKVEELTSQMAGIIQKWLKEKE